MMKAVTLGALALAISGSFSAAWASDLSGVWLTETGNSRVRVARCGAGYCGTILSAPGRALDDRNADPTLRGRSIVGVRMLEASEPRGEGYAGKLYNPGDGRTYSGSVRLVDQNSLKVSGCVLGFLCRDQTWKRVE